MSQVKCCADRRTETNVEANPKSWCAGHPAGTTAAKATHIGDRRVDHARAGWHPKTKDISTCQLAFTYSCAKAAKYRWRATKTYRLDCVALALASDFGFGLWACMTTENLIKSL